MRVARVPEKLAAVLTQILPTSKGTDQLLDAQIDEFMSEIAQADRFGDLWWSAADLDQVIEELGFDPRTLPEAKLEEIQSHYGIRHIDDAMVEAGWDSIRFAVREVLEL
jgi:hypothetical protein